MSSAGRGDEIFPPILSSFSDVGVGDRAGELGLWKILVCPGAPEARPEPDCCEPWGGRISGTHMRIERVWGKGRGITVVGVLVGDWLKLPGFLITLGSPFPRRERSNNCRLRRGPIVVRVDLA